MLSKDSVRSAPCRTCRRKSFSRVPSDTSHEILGNNLGVGHPAAEYSGSGSARDTVLSCPGGRSRRRQRRQILWMIHHLRLPPVPVLIRRSITRSSYGNTAGNRGEWHGSSTGAVYPRLRPSPVGRREIDRAGSVEFGHEQDQRGFGELADVVPAGNCVRSNCTSASSFDAPPTLRVAAAP